MRSFSYSWLTTGYLTRLTRRVPLVEQELPTFTEHLSSPPFFLFVLVLYYQITYLHVFSSLLECPSPFPMFGSSLLPSILRDSCSIYIICIYLTRVLCLILPPLVVKWRGHDDFNFPIVNFPLYTSLSEMKRSCNCYLACMDFQVTRTNK